MRVEVLRTYLPTETLGTLNVIQDDKIIFTCKTMELPRFNKDKKEDIVNETCFKEGIYTVVKEKPTEHFKYDHFRMATQPSMDAKYSTVKGRKGICWHKITYVKDLLGCIGIGGKFFDINKDGIPDIVDSTITLQKLYDILPDKFEVTVKMKPA